MVHFQKESIDALISKIEMDVFWCREAHDGIKLFIFKDIIFARLDTWNVIFSSKADFIN